MKVLLRLRICLSLVLIVISATLLGLISHSLSWKASHKHIWSLFRSPNHRRIVSLSLFPRNIETGSYSIIIAAGCGGIIDQLLYLIFTLAKRNIFGSKIPNSLVAKALIGLRIVIGIVALVFAFVQYHQSSTFDSTLLFGNVVEAEGHYTMEAWTCQTQTLLSEFRRGDFRQLCQDGKAARWLLVPYIVLSLVLLGLEFWVGGKRDKANAKKEGGAGDLGGAGASDE